MDELDRKIVAILGQNGRTSSTHIARSVGVSEGTVRRRLKRLFAEKIISVTALPDPQKLGYHMEALIGVQVSPAKVNEVAASLSDLDNIRWVAITTGSYDVFAWVTLANAVALGLFLRQKVGTIEGVQRTETFVSLGVTKRQYGIPL